MALILEDYDLSGGKTLSSEVVAPSNWRVSVRITGENNNQPTTFHLEAEDEAGYWYPVTDDTGQSISGLIIGNGLKSVNALVVNAANGRVRVVPSVDSVGTCNVDSINA